MPFQRNDVKKNKILESALMVFKERGFEGTTIIDIAKHARVNKALVYYYFQDKHNVLVNIIRYHLKKIISEVRSEFLISALETTSFTDLIQIIRKVKSDNKHFILLLIAELLKDENLDISSLIVDIMDQENVNFQSELNTMLSGLGISSEISIYNRELFVILMGVFLSDLITENLMEVMLNINNSQKSAFYENIDQIIRHIQFKKN